MASRREERMQQRMRGAQRHQVQDASFDLFLSLPETLDVPVEASPPQDTTATDSAPPASAPAPVTASPQATAPTRATPNSSAKRRRLNDGGSAAVGIGGGEIAGTVPATATGGPARTTPLSAVAVAARRISGASDRPAEEEIGESPVDAPGSGRRRSVMAIDGTAATSRTTALQEVISNTGSSRSSRSKTAKNREIVSSSSPLAVRAAKSQPAPVPATSSPPRRRSDSGEAVGLDELSPELSAMVDVPLTGGDANPATSPTADTEAQNVQESGKNTRSKTTGSGVFSKLAKSKESASANAADELSSPPLSIVLESPPDNILTNDMAVSSPLARKSTAGTRAARTTRSTRASLLSAESQASDTATPTATVKGKGRDKENAPVEELDELSPEQQPAKSSPLAPTRRTASRIRRQASEVPSSSPVSRQTRRMPLQPVPESSPRQQSNPPTRKTRDRPPRKPDVPETSVEVDEEAEENEEAEEIDALEAAKTLGRKRPRRSAAHEPSPELGSDPKQAESSSQPTAAADKEGGRPAAKRRRRQQLQEQSPSVQNQPRPAKSKKQPGKRKRRRESDGEGEDAERDGSQGEEELEGVGKAGKTRIRGAPVPITVQRYSQFRRKSRGVRAINASGDDDEADDGDEGEDELAAAGADIAFANRSGVNAVDVLAQICEDIVEQKLQALQERHQQARQQQLEAGDGDKSQAAAIRKETVVARRALESFQLELRSRLLTQAVAVDTLHALRKRVRAAHKEKLALREEILRIRAERDQVALRMDALRAQHQERVSKAMKTANISATMHDIDLAVEQGRAAPELTSTQQKAADLADLELAVRRITEQLSGGSGSLHGGGTLQQIVEFNAFLERTAAVLEGRKMPTRAVAV
ncbi:hypothetical protein SBRCBS47491_004312 [Sporothrix bragantina]|uniref:Inner kinetochore subunit AME1 domain-containing protein n=1 Tax=Sporothrix bragantina TaxID=671064 RepID=A0ABP0BMX9_9PEZI